MLTHRRSSRASPFLFLVFFDCGRRASSVRLLTFFTFILRSTEEENRESLGRAEMVLSKTEASEPGSATRYRRVRESQGGASPQKRTTVTERTNGFERCFPQSNRSAQH